MPWKKVCSVALTLLLLCVCRVTHMQWILQVLPKGWLPGQREEKNGCKLLLLNPLYFSLLNSLPATHFIYSPLSLLLAFCFYSSSNKSTHISICLSLLPLIHFFFLFFNPAPSFFVFLYRSWLWLSSWSSASPLLSSPIAPSERENAAKLISRGSWQPEAVRWWVHWWAVWTCRVTRQIPGLLVATRDKRGLGECLDHGLHWFHEALISEGNLIARLSISFHLTESISIWGFQRGELFTYNTDCHFNADRSLFCL